MKYRLRSVSNGMSSSPGTSIILSHCIARSLFIGNLWTKSNLWPLHTEKMQGLRILDPRSGLDLLEFILAKCEILTTHSSPLNSSEWIFCLRLFWFILLCILYTNYRVAVHWKCQQCILTDTINRFAMNFRTNIYQHKTTIQKKYIYKFELKCHHNTAFPLQSFVGNMWNASKLRWSW